MNWSVRSRESWNKSAPRTGVSAKKIEENRSRAKRYETEIERLKRRTEFLEKCLK